MARAKITRRSRKRRPKLNLFAATVAALEFLDDAMILIAVGTLLDDYASRGVDPMVEASAREAALRVTLAGKAVAEAQIAAQALNDELEELFAREQGLH